VSVSNSPAPLVLPVRARGNRCYRARENRLLAALPRHEYERLAPHLELTSMGSGRTVDAGAGANQNVYFPTDCIISVLQLIKDGRSVEVGVIGNEGVVGASLCLGGGVAFSHAVVQARGWAYRLRSERLKQSFNRCEATQSLVLRYTQSLYVQTAQTAVCNRHHPVLQQFIRRLLLGVDRSATTTLAMTHQSMAAKLGVRRESVTEAAGKLHGMGVISCRRGRITVLDRRALENLCCECYEVERKESARLLLM